MLSGNHIDYVIRVCSLSLSLLFLSFLWSNRDGGSSVCSSEPPKEILFAYYEVMGIRRFAKMDEATPLEEGRFINEIKIWQ